MGRCCGLIIGCLYVIVVAPRLLSGEPTSVPLHLSLPEALRIAQRRHVDVLVANERIEQALARLGQARSVLFPHFTASASETRQTRNLEASGITLPGRDPLVGPFNTFDARLKATQTLFDVAALQRLRAAKAGHVLSLAEADKVRQDVLALVATLYIEAQRATDGLELAHAILNHDEEQLRIAQSRLNFGLGSTLELSETEAQTAASRHLWQAAIAEAIERQLDLTAALGLPSNQPIVFTQEIMTATPSMPSTQEITTALGSHPDVEAAQQFVKERVAERAAERDDWLPKISASADYGSSGKTLGNSEGTYTFGAQVSMPVFEGGLRLSRLREATSQVHESQVRLSDTEHHVEASVLSASAGITQAIALVDAADQSLQTALTELGVVQHRLQTGMSSGFDVLGASMRAARAKDDYEAALATYHIAQVHLAHAMGHMTQWAETGMP